jgi:hypothetical protein
MRGNHFAFVLDAEAGEQLVGVAEGVPIGRAAHDDSDDGLAWFGHAELQLGEGRVLVGGTGGQRRL